MHLTSSSLLITASCFFITSFYDGCFFETVIIIIEKSKAITNYYERTCIIVLSRPPDTATPVRDRAY